MLGGKGLVLRHMVVHNERMGCKGTSYPVCNW